jgi:hypothetical protein
MAKEFTVTLTGRQQLDLWLFIFKAGGVKARDIEAMRNLEAVCEVFGMNDIQRHTEDLKEGDTFLLKDIADRACSVGSVDLKRLIGYLGTMPENIDTALCLRLLYISDALTDVKDRKPLASVPEEASSV